MITQLKFTPLNADFNSAIKDVYVYEGGYQAGKADTGNYYNGKLIGTNLGITPNAYKAYYNQEPTVEIIKGLTKSKSNPIYKKNYWDKIKGDSINNDSVANLMLDVVVNSGTGMIKAFKTIMNATSGKKIVAETSVPFTSEEIKLLNALPQDIFFNNIKHARESFYKNLVAKKPSNSVYLNGWLKRLNKHVYSGAVSKKKNKALLIGLGITVVAIGGYAYYRHSHKKAA